MKILMTNDDSHRSPLLEIAVRYFSRLGDVTLVVPLHEQSWTGKSMTRFSPVHAHQVEICGRSAVSVSGTPADCVAVAVHNLLAVKPDLVVSGINAGFNMGLGFILSSGTVGACIEANLAGIPAIALSQALDSATRNQYTADYMIAQETVARFETQTTAVLDRFFSGFWQHPVQGGPQPEAITWNINFPFQVTDPELLRSTPLGRTRYGKCFADRESFSDGTRSFQHELLEQVRDPNPECDSSWIAKGCATVSRIDIWRLTARE